MSVDGTGTTRSIGPAAPGPAAPDPAPDHGAPGSAPDPAAPGSAAPGSAAPGSAADHAAPGPGAGAGEVAAHLRISVTRLARLLRRQADTGLSPSQLSALTSVERHGPLTLGALADHERVAPPSITKVVAKLEERGLVARAADHADRRVTRLSLTDAGRDLLAHVRRRKDVWLAARVAGLAADQRERLVAALDVLDELTGRDPA